MSRWTRDAAGCLVLVAMSGCALLSEPTAPPGCGFPEGAELAFAGRNSARALGLARGDSFDDAVGQIYVTRDSIPHAGSVPFVPGQAPTVPDARRFCAVVGDSMATGPVPDDWTPP